MPWAGIGVLTGALAEGLGHPFSAARGLRSILKPKYSLGAKLSNLAVFPKALAVARYVRKNRIEHMHAHWLTTPSTIAYVASTLTGVPWSCTGHAHDIYADNLLAQKAASARFVRIISRRNWHSFNRFTGNAYIGRTRVLHVGVSIPAYPADVPYDRRSLQILCPARFHPMKGHRYLLEALALLQAWRVPFHCDLAGDGELQRDVESEIRRLRLEQHVTVRGVVPYEQLLDEVRRGRYDAIALASVEDPAVTPLFEGIPVALIEAMAAGIPCVSTSIGSIPELVDADNGILVGQKDPQAFAHALARLAAEPRLRARMGRAARARASAEFDASRTVSQLYDLLCNDGTCRSERAANAARAAQ
jgi:glycosyltransferase involved in cell wall biosynthesis